MQRCLSDTASWTSGMGQAAWGQKRGIGTWCTYCFTTSTKQCRQEQGMSYMCNNEAVSMHVCICTIHYVLYLYSMVGRSIADISDPRHHIYWGTKRRGTYAAKAGYRGYGPTYHTIYDILYGECATDDPFCVRQPNIFEKTPFFTQRLICHIPNLTTIHNFLWLHNHHTIYI